MRKLQAALIAAALVIGVGSGDMAFAASKTKTTKKQQTGASQVQSSGVSALTETDCTGIGGTVADTGAETCASLKRCVTIDSTGVIRRVCIDKK